MNLLLIQIVLIGVVLAIAGRLVFSRGVRTQAVRRLGLVGFAAFAVWSILFPSVWNSIAHLVGVGRGTDVVLYALVLAFLSFTLTSYMRFRELENRYTRLARRIALDEAAPPRDPVAEPASAPAPAPAPEVPAQEAATNDDA
ncbi:DUF2304 domain-containing protein [Nostocoides sp. HKS02]|uniref:DUF2304 domain-containing protein n=1 Tax=Nostocoides sp. HKS02 TaxID=1813880 RepID=UPI0012B45418|nr:DUF2304 domain-containing protein [Tetrasphaera sp. HKS02]QGN56656.1 DUF2304 family protein [Tetrasphaera sp. HKS02]